MLIKKLLEKRTLTINNNILPFELNLDKAILIYLKRFAVFALTVLLTYVTFIILVSLFYGDLFFKTLSLVLISAILLFIYKVCLKSIQAKQDLFKEFIKKTTNIFNVDKSRKVSSRTNFETEVYVKQKLNIRDEYYILFNKLVEEKNEVTKKEIFFRLLQKINLVVEKVKDDPYDWNNMAVVLLAGSKLLNEDAQKRDYLQRAKTCLTAALKLVQKEEIYYNLGYTLFELAMLENNYNNKINNLYLAIEKLNISKLINEKYNFIYNLKGLCYYELSHLKSLDEDRNSLLVKSLENFTISSNIIIDNVSAKNNIGVIYCKMINFVNDKKDKERLINLGLKYFTDTTKLTNDSSIIYNIGNAFYELARLQSNSQDRDNLLKKSTTYYHSILNKEPNSYSTQNNLGLVYYELSKNRNNVHEKEKLLKLALGYFENVLKIKAKHSSAYNNMGIVYYELAKLQVERSEIEKFLRIALEKYEIAKTIDPQFISASDNYKTVAHKLVNFITDDSENEVFMKSSDEFQYKFR